MAKRKLPGGVTAYDTPGEALRPDQTISYDPEGNAYASPHRNWFDKVAPYAVAGTFAYPALASLLAGAPAAGPAVTGGTLPGVTGTPVAGGVLTAGGTAGGANLATQLATAGAPTAIGAAAKKFGAGAGDKGGTGAGGGTSTDPMSQFTAMLQKSAGEKQQQGQELSAQGQGALGPVLQYLQQLLGSNPAGVMDATRGERGRVIDQYDAARRSIASFGPRGGGTTGALAQSRFDQAESLADITSGARRDAVATAGELGTQLQSLGLTAEQLASADLNSIINAALNKQYLDVQKRGQTMDMWSGIGEAVGTIFGPWVLGKLPGGGPGSPAPKPA